MKRGKKLPLSPLEIDSIKDEFTRRIFQLRFLEGLSWQQVAQRVGGNNSEESVKQIACRYIKKVVTNATK